MNLSAVPFPLAWAVPPASSRGDEVSTLTVQAQGHSDLFIDPAGGEPVLTAPRLLGPVPDGDFQLSARVRVGFEETYDAGVLLVWSDEWHWAKLCFERSPQGRPMAVSVVTRDVSDDANGFTVNGDTLWLRVSRLGPAFTFHASADGAFWHLVRYFALDAPDLRIGFEAQSPLGDGCTVTFDEIRYVAARLADPRDGS